jgi:hypothetical protein
MQQQLVKPNFAPSESQQRLPYVGDAKRPKGKRTNWHFR